PLPGIVDLNTDRLQALEGFAEALAQGHPLDAILVQALGVVRSALELSCIALLLLEGPASRMQVRAESGLPDECRESLQGCCPWQVDGPEPRPLVSQDCPAAFGPCLPAFSAAGIQSLAFIPLRLHGRLADALLLGNHLAQRFPAGDLRYATTVGNLLTSATAGRLHGEADPEVQRRMEVLRVSEEKFSRIFHMSPDAIDLTRLRDGVTLDCNQNYVKLTGYPREEILGRSTLPGDLGIWVDKGDRDRFSTLLRTTGAVNGFEARLRRKDGSTYHGRLSSTTLEINGELCNLDLTWDITEEKLTHEALRISEEKFSKTFKLSPDAITITRLEDGVYLDANQGFTDMTGYLPEEIQDRSSWSGDLAFWVHPQEHADYLSELRAKGEVTNLETHFRRKDGSVRVGLLSARLINLWDEPCVLAISRDVTKKKQAEEALQESSWRLQLALESSNMGIWDWNLQDDLEIWDDRTHEIYGLPRTGIAPDFKTWLERIVHPEDAPRLREAIDAALAATKPYDLRFRIVRPDGSIRHISSH
ncbi:MAG TPA: PAS domain S-box protein, partial [Holophaga sp.]|nr:PAS domain S-box protein [Holophaga sp.]